MELNAEPRIVHSVPTMRAFRTVVFDIDSTVAGVEGIDWLAARRGELVARRVASLTNDAMRGAIPLESVYGARLAAIRPRREDIDALSRAYVEHTAPGCEDAINRLHHDGVHVVLVSGGLRPALFRLALRLGIDLADLHAVGIRFDAIGAYVGYDTRSPLTRSNGKKTLIERLELERPILMVGDGATDLAAKSAVDAFAAFTGFVSRETITARADFVIESFEQLNAMGGA
jgi:HAD superfamily phosphoserine phosphatase-like hydrolase